MGERDERFRELFDRCYQPLCAYARRRLPVADADDLVAETFTVAWRRIDDVPDDTALPWLYGVARRLLANQLRSGARRLRLSARLHGEAPALIPTADHADLHDALSRLRPDDREVLRLAAWEDLPPADIAIVLGCSPNAAALRLSRARQRLREQLTGTTAIRTQTTGKVTDA